jgi:chaperonin GroES
MSNVAELKREFVNTSGILPVDKKVVVLPERLEEVTSGGIVIPDTVRERHDMAHLKATIIAVGAQAFEHIEDKAFRPTAGMVVSIAKYAGYLITGKDGEEYRIINDDDVVAVLDGNWDIRGNRT